jgi:Flp pilus assembly protein TadD
MKHLPFFSLLVALLLCSTPDVRAQLPNFNDALNKAKDEIIKLVKPNTAGKTPPAEKLTPIQQTIEDILADTANMDAQGARDTIALYVARVTSGYGGIKPVKPAVAYSSAGAVFFVKSYFNEAIYCYAKAARLEPQNAEWLNDLASSLLEREKTEWAKTLLLETIRLYPNLDPPMGNLAAIYLDAKQYNDAITLLQKAIALSPTTGLYYYLYGKALEGLGNKSKAQQQYVMAWMNGYAGSGREGDPNSQPPPANPPGNGNGNGNPSTNTPDANAPTNNSINNSQHATNSTPYPPAPDFNEAPIPAAWVGHYEADYVRGKTLHIKQYGSGMTGTNVREDILTCTKSFSMDIDQAGNITGQAKVMYVYLGKAMNPAMSMAPGFMVAKYGNFMATIKDGSEILDFNFTGKVDSKGIVEINGMPEGQLDFYNAGQWQKINPWNVLPPPDNNPRGAARMQLATEKKSGIPSIYINRVVKFSADMTLTYQAYIKKSDTPITCDCKLLEPPKPTCPASQYLKAKASVGADGHMTVETSHDLQTGDNTTTTKVSGGAEAAGVSATGSVDAAGNVSVEGSVGMLVGSEQYNMVDGSYQMTVGLGINTGSALPGPNKISEKVELVYDSACGWGIKGTAGITTMSMGAGVEGCVYFNRGK